MRIIRLLRPRLPFELEQVVGLLMIAGACALAWRPYTTSLTWLATLWTIPGLTTAVIALFGAAGFALTLCSNACAVTFAALTSPIALYGTLAFAYVITNEQSVFGAGMFGAFWIALQFAHAQQREVRQWTRRSESS